MPQLSAIPLSGASTDGETTATFNGSAYLSSDSNIQEQTSFSINDSINVQFSVVPAVSDRGQSVPIYVYGTYYNQWYMKNEQGHWLTFEKDIQPLVKSEMRVLGDKEVITVLSDFNLLGKFSAYVGYGLPSGGMVSNSQGLEFEIVNINSLYIEDSSITLRQGGSQDIKVLERSDDGSSRDVTSQVSFNIADTSIISINSGKIQALAKGQTSFKASLNGIDSNDVSVTVIEKLDSSKIIKNSLYDQYQHLIPADASLIYDHNKFAIITGIAKDKVNNPIDNVSIKILNNSQYGSVKTNNDGKFNIPVEGGTSLTVSYQKDGFLPVHREIDVPVQNWANVETVALSRLDTKVTDIDFSTGKTALHVSSKTNDDRGERETTLVFDGISKATVKRADGSTHELKNIKVRATEFDTPASMPAKLPEGTAFTFASALTLDGVEAGSQVDFDKPVVIYLDNFLGFNVGEAVPVGFYNEKTGKWEAADNGVVVKLLDTDNDGNIDSLDSDGDDKPNDLNRNSDTSDEVAGIKDNAKYAAGKTYWRAEIPHFTTYDLNYGSKEKLDEKDKQLDDNRKHDPETNVDEKYSDSDCGNSYVDVQNQVYHEDIAIAGTDMTLNYASNRVKGYKHVVTTQVSGDEIPSALLEIIAKFEIAGRTYTQTLAAEPNQNVEFVWDGLDSDGKKIEGTTTGKLSIGYKYEAYYLKPPSARKSFGQNSNEFTDVKANPVIKWKSKRLTFNTGIKRHKVSNGWTLSNNHFYTKGVIAKGDGTDINNSSFLSLKKINGELINKEDNYNTVDYWEFDSEGGLLKIDVLSEYSGNSNNYVDLNGNNKQDAVDIEIFLFKKDNNGNWLYIAQNDDSSNLGEDGSVHQYDSYLALDLEEGEYLLTVSNYSYSKEEALAGLNSDTNYRNGGPYQVIFNQNLSFVSLPYNSKFILNKSFRIIDGSLIYIFDIDGKHLKTLDTQTDKILTTFEYDSNDKLIAIKDRFDNTTTIERDSNGTVTAIKAPNGQVTNLTIDGNGNLTTVTYEDSSNYQFAYNDGNLMTSEIEPKGNIFTHEFNANGRVTKVADEEGGWKNYNKNGNNYVIETAAGSRRNIVMDGINKQKTSASGQKSIVNYTDNGMTKTVQSCGIESLTHYTLDQKTADEVIKDQTLKLPSGKTLTTSIERIYVFNDDKTTKTLSINSSSNGNTAVVNTDYTQGLTTTSSAMGRVTKSYFDTNTLLPSKEEITGLHPTSYSYDNKGRLIATKTGDRQQQISYDSRGNIASLTDEEGKVTRFGYDPVDRLLKTTTPSGAELQYQYDQNGNITVFSTPTANDHKFTFNRVNKTTAYTSALGSATRYEYDLERKLQKVSYPSGKYKKNNYTGGLVTSVETPEGTSEFEYDCLENLNKVTYGSETINYSYDGSLLTGIAYAGILNQNISLDYDNDLRISQLNYADGNQALIYDKDGLLTNRGKFTIDRNADNGLPMTVKDSSLEIGRQYNAYGDLTQEATNINGNALFSYATTRNKIGKIITKTETIAAQSIKYEYNYDADGRLIEVIKNANSVETYQYDANGNRTDTNVNKDDQVISYQGINYQYDDDGYLSSKQDTNGTTTYEYGIFGELKKVVLPDGKVIEYLHNANHQRIAKKVNSVITEKYLWLGLTTLLAVYDKDNNLLMRFNYADSRMPLSMQKGGQQYYLHYDQVGTLKLVTDSAGNIVKQVDYDSYGNVLNDSDTNFRVPFGFAGGLYDADTQLTRFGYRDYDAFSGRWTAKDPIGFAGGDGNLYGYVLNDPINFIDKEGLIFSWLIDKVAIALGYYGIPSLPSLSSCNTALFFTYNILGGTLINVAIGAAIGGGVPGAIVGGITGFGHSIIQTFQNYEKFKIKCKEKKKKECPLPTPIPIDYDYGYDNGERNA